MSKLTAGLLMYRKKGGGVEVFLVHPGGPFYKNKDEGVWDFPKGGAEEGEDLLEAAKREFREETNHEASGEFEYVGNIKHNGKQVEVWMFEGEIDPEKFRSNTTFIDWPPRSGKKMEIPEMDRGEFFSLPDARKKLRAYLVPILEEFEKKLGV